MKPIFLTIALIIVMNLNQCINLNQHLNYNHLDIFQSTDRELCIRGGANAGKSYTIADKLLIQPLIQGDRPLKALIIKQTQPSLRDTVIDIFQKREDIFKFGFRMNMQTLTGRLGNMVFLFRSMNNQEDYRKIKSYTDIDFIWINEITEIREEDYKMLTTRLRGGKGEWAQILFDFNPIGTTSWVYRRFFEDNFGDVRKLRYTVLDNPWAKKEEVDALLRTKHEDPNFYKIYFLGEWGDIEGVIYDWDEVPLPNEDLDWYDEIWYGGDFGYSINPAAVIRIYRKADEYWVEEVIYQTKLTNTALGKLMRERGIRDDETIYFDSAEPKSIEELYQMDFDVHPAIKGPDSVKAGVDFLRAQNIHVVEGNTHILKEMRSYVHKKDKDGRALEVPIEHDNHAMDAIRYGIYSHRGVTGQFMVV